MGELNDEWRTIWRWQARRYERAGWRISRSRILLGSIRPRWLLLHPFTWFDEIEGWFCVVAFRDARDG